jgi:DNA-binding beta-propeller fold protein YncE
MVKPSPRRRALVLAGAAAATGLVACAAPAEPPRRIPPPASDALLRPWLSIAGGWRLDAIPPLQTARPTGTRVNFVQPVGVAARNDVLLVADAGARTIWRMDRIRDALAPIATLTGSVPDHGVSMQMGNDFTFWVALPADHMVVQYDPRGQVARRWRDDFDAPRPVAVAVPEDRTSVLVADAATARIVVFDPLGRARHVLGGNRPPSLQSIAAMAFGPRGLYVLDRLAQQVVVLDRAGVPVQVIGENQLVQPRAMAVDASGRVFVGDDLEQRIKVFRDRRLLASVGGAGNGPGRFGRIESMAIDGNLLYVADSLNARVQVMMIAPASLESPEAPR